LSNPLLFEDLPEHPTEEQLTFKALRHPIWTENKARLVARYLYYFVLITKHGCYIDGFAGPKQPGVADSWAAQLVVEIEPKLLRQFFLCDNDHKKVGALQALRDLQPPVRGRTINVIEGDFNEQIAGILGSGVIKPTTAAFCLIDQFSTECHWATLKTVAAHKPMNKPKIELFYFLASGWLERALEGFTKNLDVPERWWGRPDWRSVIKMPGQQRAQNFCQRFREELGYRFAHAWPIMDKGDRGRVMFHMIHASDHDEAPRIMYRAFTHATLPLESKDQLELPLSQLAGIARAYQVPTDRT
jgi:three-Cys-motif partner protein